MKGLYALLTASTFSLCASCSSAEKPCEDDFDCSGEKICVQGKCVKPSTCVDDWDCPGELVCEYNGCVEKRTSPQGMPSSGTMPDPITPQDAWSGLKAALADSNIEQAVLYFSPHVQEEYRGILAKKDLKDLAEKLSGLPPLPETAANGFSQYEIKIDGKEYAILFNCSHGKCKIIGF